ncbi:phage portal protein [Arcanobacterium canis]
MSFLTRIKDIFTPAGNDVPFLIWGGGVETVLKQTPAQLYRTQPHLQTVIKFRARNVAQLGLHAYERTADHDRRSGTGSALDMLIHAPNPDQTMYELMAQLVSDYDLYGVAYWIIAPDLDADSGWQIRPLSPTWVTGTQGGTMWAPEHYLINTPHGTTGKLPASEVLAFREWNPTGRLDAFSPIDALKDVLAEQIEAWKFRRQVWERGGRVGAYITRPKDAPWSEEARLRFMQSWREFQANGAKAGSTPLLEDGMTLNRSGFSAREEEWAESTKLSLQTVAAVYHVQPAMIGATEGASYASTREFRSMLYTETLGPLLRMIEARLNQFLVPKIAPGSNLYLEFNIDAKLSGNFEEQASILSTATGAPWMTVNEARALRNLSRIDGGDDLVVPLNVIKGGQASPQDGGTPPPAIEAAKEE